ncbi:MAG: hypothetical protein AAFY64_03120, partial [Pseudomonadota bacterium]
MAETRQSRGKPTAPRSRIRWVWPVVAAILIAIPLVGPVGFAEFGWTNVFADDAKSDAISPAEQTAERAGQTLERLSFAPGFGSDTATSGIATGALPRQRTTARAVIARPDRGSAARNGGSAEGKGDKKRVDTALQGPRITETPVPPSTIGNARIPGPSTNETMQPSAQKTHVASRDPDRPQPRELSRPLARPTVPR